ncbi:hypothetical protein [Staphylococcus aureus]
MSRGLGDVYKRQQYINVVIVCFLMIRRPPRSTRKESSAASDVYKRQVTHREKATSKRLRSTIRELSLIHISEPTRH